MKKQVKMLSAILVIMMILCSVSNVVFGVSSIISQVGDPNNATTVSGRDDVIDLGSTIVGILQIIGIVVAVVVLLVLGIKYMMGSAEEKAEYKKTMIPYVIGALLIFAAATIVNVLYGMFSQV